MSVYVGTSGTKKEISSIHIGKSGGKKEVVNGYTLKNGSVAKVYSNVAKPGQTVFTTSGTFTVPNGVTSVDVFLVGGGGSGGKGWTNINTAQMGSHGGGGGYTTTAKGVSVYPGNKYNIAVGSGGNTGAYRWAVTAGSSTALGYTAEGGKSGVSWYWISKCWNDCSCGGSGGGCGGTRTNTAFWHGGNGGYDGGPGYSSSGSESWWEQTYGVSGGGNGQGTTTRAFGTGTIYSGGGGGGSYHSGGKGGSGGGGNGSSNVNTTNATSGTNGAGGGGGGGATIYKSDSLLNYGNGGSGCVIIRWGY